MERQENEQLTKKKMALNEMNKKQIEEFRKQKNVAGNDERKFAEEKAREAELKE